MLHTIEINNKVLNAEDGLILGNGDLSVSVYEKRDSIVWRFGKGDVWDRRIDLKDDPKPAHINEVAHGIKDEGWTCNPYGGGKVEAKFGTSNPKRMNELCQGCPSSYDNRPYPCPKPVGELEMHLPPDLPSMNIHQSLLIEEAKIKIVCTWSFNIKVEIECFIPPKDNVLIVKWQLFNWNEETMMGCNMEPIWFSLYRWADPSLEEAMDELFSKYRCHFAPSMYDKKVTPLIPPSVKNDSGLLYIEQSFYKEPTFEQGFKYILAPFAEKATIKKVDMSVKKEARLHIIPENNTIHGNLIICITTSSDDGGALCELRNKAKLLSLKNTKTLIQNWGENNLEEATKFWGKSNVSIADKLLEKLWYETLHVRRCIYHKGTVPPGLFIPSTVKDYSHWHGDYHTNYNFQQPFWGSCTSNHVELLDAYFEGINYILDIGKKIARDYYDCKGAFIQLSGYPIKAKDDPIGIVPMGRMAYMTGWAMTLYWQRYLYTMDIEWLKSIGYKVIRDCALFYADFMKIGDDGLYHVFPSNQGEEGFSGNVSDFTDREEVMRYLRYCLKVAIKASEVLNVDKELRANWKERLRKCAGDEGKPQLKLNGIEKECYERNQPEFGFGMPYKYNRKDEKPWPKKDDPIYSWYFGHYPLYMMGKIRSGKFNVESNFTIFRTSIERWRHQNGLIWAMAIANYGLAGAWTESLGVLAPLQDMMLQSWDGALRIFPLWPKEINACYKNFRAEGAFLVSAKIQNGVVKDIQIISEKGGVCKIYNPSNNLLMIKDEYGEDIKTSVDEYDRISFITEKDREYYIDIYDKFQVE